MYTRIINGQAQTWTPDFVAIGKAYGAGRNSDDESAVREAEKHGRSFLDKARYCWNLEQWRDKKIKPCPKCGSLYCSKQCYVCSIVAKVAKGWTSNAGREKFTPEWLAEDKRLREVAAVKRKEAAVIKAREAAKAWRCANPERARATTAAWIAANPEKAKAARLAYRAANPEVVRISNQNRRAKKRANGGKLSKGLAAKLFKLQKGKCPCCAKPLGNNYHMDHIMPLALGGSNTDDNMQLLRQRCNNQKHSKHPVDFMQSRGFLL